MALQLSPWSAAAFACVVGAAVASRHGVSVEAFAPNLAGLAVGGALLVMVHLRSGVLWSARWPVAAVALVALTLGAEGLEGVHRWLPLGPLRLNASVVVLPWLFLGPRTLVQKATWGAVQVLHLAQPDAGQATVLAAMVWARERGSAFAWGLSAVALATWSRADPLPAVPHVEGVLELAAQAGAWFLIAALLALVGLAWPWRRAELPRVWVLASVAVALIGKAPVPVLGAGVAPVLGYLTLALLRVPQAEPDVRPS